jgi:hypothetical protein
MIIAFAGRKQSGKTTCSEFIRTYANASIQPYNATKIYNFADPLKQDICMNILGLSYQQCYGTDDQKNELVNCFWDNRQLTAREVMQMVGTEMFRTMQKNVWSDATIRKIHIENPPLAIIADCRFPNEVEAIKNANGLIIKLKRNPYNSSHASELALDPEHYPESNFDLVIENDNLSINEQNQIIHHFLFTKGILPL